MREDPSLAFTIALFAMSSSAGDDCRMTAATSRMFLRRIFAACSAASPPMPAPRDAQVPPP